jgi:hypothetical protein
LDAALGLREGLDRVVDLRGSGDTTNAASMAAHEQGA